MAHDLGPQPGYASLKDFRNGFVDDRLDVSARWHQMAKQFYANLAQLLRSKDYTILTLRPRASKSVRAYSFVPNGGPTRIRTELRVGSTSTSAHAGPIILGLCNKRNNRHPDRKANLFIPREGQT